MSLDSPAGRTASATPSAMRGKASPADASVSVPASVPSPQRGPESPSSSSRVGVPSSSSEPAQPAASRSGKQEEQEKTKRHSSKHRKEKKERKTSTSASPREPDAQLQPPPLLHNQSFSALALLPKSIEQLVSQVGQMRTERVQMREQLAQLPVLHSSVTELQSTVLQLQRTVSELQKTVEELRAAQLRSQHEHKHKQPHNKDNRANSSSSTTSLAASSSSSSSSSSGAAAKRSSTEIHHALETLEQSPEVLYSWHTIPTTEALRRPPADSAANCNSLSPAVPSSTAAAAQLSGRASLSPRIQISRPEQSPALLSGLSLEAPPVRSFEEHYQVEVGATVSNIDGVVLLYAARSKATDERVLVKQLLVTHLDPDQTHQFLREVVNLRSLNHPHIVRLVDFFQDRSSYYVVLERVEGQALFAKILERGHYSEEDAQHLVRQVCDALAYCHAHGIAHRDLKPESLLVSGQMPKETVKIADFGLSKNFFSSGGLLTAVGSTGYVAPEVLKGSSYDQRVDLWALGVILYILLCGYPPFFAESRRALLAKIAEADYTFGDGWEMISDEGKDLVRHLLVRDPAHRFSAADCLKHPWLAPKNPGSPGGNAPTWGVRPLNQDDRMRKSLARLRTFMAARRPPMPSVTMQPIPPTDPARKQGT